MEDLYDLFPSCEMNIEIEEEFKNKRKAYRVKVKNIFVKIKDKTFKVKDISSSGIGFWIEKDFKLKEGDEISLDIFISDKPFLLNLKSKVVRKDGTLIGCEFINLDRRKEFMLDKLILELQKREILLKKGKKFK